MNFVLFSYMMKLVRHKFQPAIHTQLGHGHKVYRLIVLSGRGNVRVVGVIYWCLNGILERVARSSDEEILDMKPASVISYGEMDLRKYAY